MNRLDKVSKDKEEEDNVRGNCTKQTKILGTVFCYALLLGYGKRNL